MARLQPGQDFGPYRVVERAGVGGMATVYKAYQASLSRFVALKLLPENLAEDPEFLARFEREAKSVASLRHPSIPAVHDFGTEGGTSFIVTEYVDGGTLAEQMGKPLPLSYVVEVLRPIANALDYAHSRGILHRDIKPSNILLSREGRPVLNDFGLAQILVPDIRLTAQGALMGTPSYMAPEQAQGHDLTPAADNYALATVAYEMLTGRVPFAAATPAAVMMAQVTEPPPPARSLNPAISTELELVLTRALTKEPESRYPTAGQLVSALEAAAATGAALGVGATPVWGQPGATVVTPPSSPGPQPSSAANPGAISGEARGEALAAPRLSNDDGRTRTMRPIDATPAGPRSRRPVVVGGALIGLVLLAALFVGLGLHLGGAPGSGPNQVPRGALIWKARLNPGTRDLAPWGSVSPPDAAQQTLTGSALQYRILKPGSYIGNSWQPPQLSDYVGELRIRVPGGSKVTADWTLVNGDSTTTGDHLLRFDIAAHRMILMFNPPGRAGTGRDPDTLGHPLDEPWLSQGGTHLVDVKVTQTNYTIYLDGRVAESVDEGRTPKSSSIDLGAFGDPGSVTFSDLAVYAIAAP